MGLGSHLAEAPFAEYFLQGEVLYSIPPDHRLGSVRGSVRGPQGFIHSPGGGGRVEWSEGEC